MIRAAEPLGIEGLVAAPFTPFQINGQLDLDRIPALADALVRDGVIGVFVCGSNGEGPNMTTAERMAVAAAWIAAAAGRLKVIVHVGHASIADACALAAHAAAHGADAASATAPFYFKLSSVGNLIDCMVEIAGSAPSLPFYYYHIPSLTGALIDMVAFIDQAPARIPNFAGLKYTASSLWEYQACLVARPDLDVLFGYDEMLLPALSAGAKGAVGSTYNFAAPLYRSMMAAFHQGHLDVARREMAVLVGIVRAIVIYPAVPAQKAIMRMRGLDVGPCRLPLQTLSPEQVDELSGGLERAGLWRALGEQPT